MPVGPYEFTTHLGPDKVYLPVMAAMMMSRWIERRFGYPTAATIWSQYEPDDWN